MLRPVIAVADADRVEGAQRAISVPIDAAAVSKRRDSYVAGWHDDGQADGLKHIGINLVRGHGRLDGSGRVAVETADGEQVMRTARHAVEICGAARRHGMREAPRRTAECTGPYEPSVRVTSMGGAVDPAAHD